jgi:predicted amidohydrolase YtcJ
MPPWIHAGNLDNKYLMAGTTLFIPVHARGAQATRMAVREAIDFLVIEKHLTRDDAYMLSRTAARRDCAARSKAGKLADLAVLSADPLSAREKDIRGIASLMTVAGGRIVHESGN